MNQLNKFIFISFFWPCALLADALPPPSTPAAQIATAPHARPLVADSKSGVFRYPGHGDVATITRPPHYKTVSPGPGGTLTGNKTHPVRLTNNYGQVATGQIRTATTVNSGTLDKAVTSLIGLNIIGNILNSSNAHNAAEALANGRYDEAALSAAAALDAVSGIGSGVNSLVDTYRQAQDAKTAALVAEHQQAAQTYEQVKNLPEVYVVYQGHRQGSDILPYPGFGIYGVYSEPVILSGGQIFSANGNPRKFLGHYPFMLDGLHVSYYVHSSAPTSEMFYKPITPEQLMLSQQEMTQILLDQLHNNNSALNQNTQALTDLLNALVAGGHLDPSKQSTQVLGSPAENTFLTAPFTPAGSDTAQQTQFVVNSDGSVTVSTINRPDLAAHTSQAPTRAEVGQTATAPDTVPAKPSATTEAPDVCANNPNSLMCADMGSGDYTDPVIPTKSIPLDFKPADIFSTDGVCPAPVAIEVMGVTKQWNWEPTCDGARKIRPIVIASIIIMCGMFVFGAIREL